MLRKVVFLALASLCIGNTYISSQSASQSVIVKIICVMGSMDSISISGNPNPMFITSAKAGDCFKDAIDSTTTYAVTTNNSARKIYGSLFSPMPPGVTLSMALQPPRGAISNGPVPLSTANSQLVTGIYNVTQGSLNITYILSATVKAAQTMGASNTIMLTIAP